MYGYGNSMFLATHGILARSNAAVLPVNTVAPVISGSTSLGSVLSSTIGTWTGTPIITFAYQWYRGATLITGATSSTYTIVTADVGQSIKCTVTATNGAGSVNADSNTVTPTSALDPDAQAFITAASITDPTQQSAINTLVISLKGYNIWTKFKAIYPIVGGVASSHAVNLKTPGTFNLSFQTGWTHSANGMTPNGATFANSFLIPNTTLTLNSTHISYYSRTNVAEGVYDMGSQTLGNDYLVLNARNPANNFRVLVNEAAIGDFANSDSRGLFVANRTGASVRNSFVNGVKKLNNTAASGLRSTNAIYLGAINNGGSASLYSTKQCAFASIGDGLTDTESANFYTAVQAYQTTLSRQV